MDTTDLQRLTWLRQAFADGSAVTVRQRARLTQAEIADVLGVSRSLYSLWEGKRRAPRGPAALRAAVLLQSLADQQVEPQQVAP